MKRLVWLWRRFRIRKVRRLVEEHGDRPATPEEIDLMLDTWGRVEDDK